MSTVAQPVSRASDKPARMPSGWHELKALIPYVLRYKRFVALGFFTLAVMGIVGALPQLVIGTIMDCLRGSAVPLSTLTGTARTLLQPIFAFYSPKSSHALAIYCAIIVGAMVVKGIFSYWTRWILIGMSRDIEYDLRNDVLQRLLALDPEFYGRNRTGDLMSRATNDLNAVRMVLGPGIMYTAVTLMTMVLAIFFMVRLSPSLTMWVLIPVPFVALAVRYFGQIIHRLSEQIQAALGVLSTRAQENLTGIRVVRAYAQEQAEIDTFDEANKFYVGRNIKLISSWSLFFPALSVLIGSTVVILIALGGPKAIDGQLTLGSFTSFEMFLTQLVFPMIAIGYVTNIFQRGAASMGRLNYILNARPNIQDRSTAALAPAESNGQPIAGNGKQATATSTSSIRGDIEFRHLSFAYPTGSNGAGGATVLHDINLHVPVGATLAIVGPTGSGKSTLASLIGRLWEAPRGTLLIDGKDVDQYPLAELRRAIGYVPQDTFLFSDTIRGNIAFGVSEAAEEHVYEAAEIAGISGEIQGFPHGFDTVVGERGITLSGGQKQRTSIARAILRQPRILILDDALSSVDTETEERILRQLRGVMSQRTTILISHRISTVRTADQIVVMREGRIIERGSHDELLALGGYYADLYQKQLLEEELERE
jgi:ATP-binding cassette, subfamily B, multidrug efflux pump